MNFARSMARCAAVVVIGAAGLAWQAPTAQAGVQASIDCSQVDGLNITGLLNIAVEPGDVLTFSTTVNVLVALDNGAPAAATSPLAITDAQLATISLDDDPTGQTVTCTPGPEDGGDPTEAAVDGLSKARGWAIVNDLPNLPNRIEPKETATVSGLGDSAGGVASFDGSIGSFNAFGVDGVFSAWVRGSYAYVSEDRTLGDIDSDVGQLQLGVDYRPTDRAVIGLMLHGDVIEQDSAANQASADGVGFMIGPYGAYQLDQNFYLEGVALFGRAFNTATATNGVDSDYDSDRLLLSTRLSGDIFVDQWNLRPGARVTYYAERNESFVDGLGAAIAEDTETLGQIRVGGEVGYDLLSDGRVLRPFVGADGVYSFASDDSVVTGGGGGADGLTATLSAGVEASLGGASVRGRFAYDGLGEGDFEALRGSAEIRLPF